MEQFKHPANLNMMWELLLDEFQIGVNDISARNVNTIFQANINMFVIKTNMYLPIMELNKLFLSQVVAAVNNIMPDLKLRKKIKILEEVPSHKIEDVQAFRQNQLEHELKIKQMEMEQYLTPQKPAEPKFADSLDFQTDAESVESLLARQLEERNVDLLPPPPAKKVTFASDFVLKAGTSTFLSKLKKKQDVEEPSMYEQQDSVPLQTFMEEPSQTPATQQQTTTIIDKQMIPMSEIVKQLNELNRKVDLLLEKYALL
jgi:hypothetical protein